MGMNVSSGRSDSEPIVDINTTPLIDVMLVLLIMLIITIPIQLHSVNMNNPVGNPPPSQVQPVIVRIDVGADGFTRWNGEVVPDHVTLEDRLADLRRLPDPPEIHLRAEPRAAYRNVAAVMASAQRLGLTKIGIVGIGQP